MRLSLVFEFLLIFVLVAFAASRVIDPKEESYGRALRKQHHHHHVAHKNRQQDSPNKYCSCSAKLCNCCRDFNIPVVALQGPGCASLQYLRGDRLAISMSFGDRVLTNTTIDGKKPKPVCMPLPGGVSKFCGRVYNIGRQGEDFNACLGLELRAVQDVEAALRVSCFRFGPKGLKVEPPQPLPVVQSENTEDDEEDDDDDDDDDDEFDFDDVDDIEDDDDDEDEEETEDDDADNDVDSVDYGTFSVFDDDFIDSFFVPSESGTKKKKATTTTTVKPPVKKITRKPLRTVTKKTVASTTPVPTTKKAVVITSTTVKPIKKQKLKKTKKPQKTTTPIATSTTTQATTSAANMQLITSATIVSSENVSDVKLSEGVVVPSSPHESIAAVTAMLQNIPGEGMPQADLKPTASAPEPTVMPASDPMPTEKQSEYTTTEQAVTQETMKEEVTEASETTTSMATTQMDVEEDEDEDEDEEVAASQNYIIKNDETAESEEDSDPITDVVGDVISDEIDDDDDDDEEETKSTTPVAKVEKDEKKKTEKKDVFTDIIDGVVDTFTGAESDEGTKNESADDDDDDDEEDDDDVDFETRKAKQHQSKKNGGKFRQSRDMWLGRLHW